MAQIRVHVTRTDDDIHVPDTGVMTQPVSGSTTSGVDNISYYSGLGITVAIFLIVILPVLFVRRWKSQGLSKRSMASRIFMLTVFSFGVTFAALSFARESASNSKAVDQMGREELTASADDIDIYVELEDEPVFKTVASTIKVDKATEGGYILKSYVSAPDLTLEGDSSKKISGLTTSEPGVLTEGAWGISLEEATSQDNTTWQAIPSTEATALTDKYTTMATLENDQMTVYYGVYVSPDMDAGIYTGTLNYDATANLVMQDVSEWGDAVQIGQEVIAVDKRDGKTYTVARLADDRLWMTQNLDHDIDSAKTYTSEDTDLPTDTTWVPSSSTFATDNDSWVTSSSWEEWYISPFSYDPGEKYWNGELSNSASNPSADYLVDEGDSHYHLGNYYTWGAAVAMNDTSSYTVAEQFSNQSICPAGWTLPRGWDGIGSFYKLMEAYGFSESSIDDNTGENAWSAPLFFNLSGYYSGHGLSGVTAIGYSNTYRSSTIANGGYARHMEMTSDGVIRTAVTNMGGRRTGHSIRCIARDIYRIVYNGNQGSNNDSENEVVGSMGELSHIVENGTSIQLYASNFSRANYGFAGWSLDPEAGTKINTANQPKIYGPNETITISETEFPDIHKITFYAVWVPKSSEYTMQSFDSSAFSSYPNGYVIALEDERDHDIYAAAKLADGNFWMIENLRIDSDANWDESLSQGYRGQFVGLAEPETITFSETTASNSLYSIDGSTAYVIDGDRQAYRFPRYNNQNTIDRSSNPVSGNENLYSYGNYYTWPAAIADTSDYLTNGQFTDGTSICPAGWHLPTGSFRSDEESSYKNLGIAFGNGASSASNAPIITSFPNNVVFNGFYTKDGFNNRTLTSPTWTSDAYYFGTSALSFVSSTSAYLPGSRGYDRFWGAAVRCIAD